jgi:transcriptional regulator with XRE-family HTH domain
MDDSKAIGARIRQVRKAQGLTQVDLSAAIGVTRSHLTNVERGSSGLGLDKLSLLAAETGTTVGWLIGESQPLDRLKSDLLDAFDALDQRDREALLRIAQGLQHRDVPSDVNTQPRRRRAAGCSMPVIRLRR